MRVLFLCKANVSRSQMAAVLYNQLTNTQDADSAGTDVDVPGETLGQRRQRLGGSHSLELMHQVGIDLSQNKRMQLTQAMLKGYDKIISMHDEALAPDWLLGDPRYEFWDIPDPNGKEETKKTKQLLLDKIHQLISK